MKRNVVTLDELKRKGVLNRIAVLSQIWKAGKGHIGGTFSCIDLLTVIYYQFMEISKENLKSDERNRFLIGKGHACLAIYNILDDMGFFEFDLLEEYKKDGGFIGGQMDISVPGVETNTGSLGHALGMGCGLALGAQLDSKLFKTFVLLGDGECDEGAIWESVYFAGQNKLSNLYAIIDRNWQTVTEKINVQKQISSLEEKFKSAGWNVSTIDGHNYEEIISAVSNETNQPKVIIADTIKGKGISFIENGIAWHHTVPKDSQYHSALNELKAKL